MLYFFNKVFFLLFKTGNNCGKNLRLTGKVLKTVQFKTYLSKKIPRFNYIKQLKQGTLLLFLIMPIFYTFYANFLTTNL